MKNVLTVRQEDKSPSRVWSELYVLWESRDSDLPQLCVLTQHDPLLTVSTQGVKGLTVNLKSLVSK